MEFTRYIWDLYATSECGRAAVARPVDSVVGERIDLDTFALELPLLRSGPDGEPTAIDGEFVSFHVRYDVRAHFAKETATDNSSARALFTSLVDEGLSISIRGANEERCYFGGEEFEEDVFSNIEGVSLAL